jgi:hypothetical protein
LTELDLIKLLKSLVESLLNISGPARYELIGEFEETERMSISPYLSGCIDDYLLSRYSDFLTKLIKEYGDQQENIK